MEVQPNKAMNKLNLKGITLHQPNTLHEAITDTAMYPCQCKLMTTHHIMGPVLSKYKLSSAVKDIP